MSYNHKLFTILVVISSCYKTLASKSELCDCDVIEIYDQVNTENNRNFNFSKQSGVINGKSFYHSIQQQDLAFEKTFIFPSSGSFNVHFFHIVLSNQEH